MKSKTSIKDRTEQPKGELEFIIKDRHGKVIDSWVEQNLVKIFAKEILSYRASPAEIWDPSASSGEGAWVDSGIDPLAEFIPRYILLGGAFDDDGTPLGKTDDRYYIDDPSTGERVARVPNVGADNQGGLINGIPISEPTRPLKRLENAFFEPTYQPTDSPLISSDVRAIGNILVVETTLKKEEYNQLGASNTIDITEVALAAAPQVDALGACECLPRHLFLEGVGGSNDTQLPATADGTSSITLKDSVASEDVDRIGEGDQLFVVAPVNTGGTGSGGSEAATEEYGSLDQPNQFYLVTAKTNRSITLDRTIVDSDGNAIIGDIGVYRSPLRLFSQRILSAPISKNEEIEIVIRWRIIFN